MIATDSLSEAHDLRGTEIEIGLPLNFAVKPELRRLIFDKDRKRIRVNPRASVAA